MPRKRLFRQMILGVRWYWWQVDNSWMFIWIDASPVITAMSAPGLAICTPMA
ncbi:Uncharacterised protein [Bordetella pertussis]|nr:Uncharacterised protein [Bordetella pertussis]CFO80103.1 Uncharacterised protein [Bordetella pertussis]CFP62057.1 Uncharacterised protein [Bordetella pertussis]CFU90222.1 Uncharacterised protein [Bordetella pertussis]CPI70882.1 Uncharacterised protein [Bordetella pertussis]